MSTNWQYHLLKAISRLVCLLPYTIVLFIGRQLGRLYYHLAARQSRRAMNQMQESLSVSAKEAERITRRLFRKLGQTFMEVLYTPVLTPEKIKQLVTLENDQYLADAVSQGHGVVLLTAHIGNWEWLGAALAMAGFPLTTLIKKQPNDQHTRILNEYRQKVGMEIFSRGTSELVGAARALKKGKILSFLADQDAGVSGVFVSFLGKAASTPLGPAVFAKRFHSPIVPVFIVRRPEGGHRAIVEPPLIMEDTGDETVDLYNATEKMTRIIEAVIRQYPDEWLWFQKRWNTAPRTPLSHRHNRGTPTLQERIGEQA
ncbi:MAG: lysophospholipid acyltransferase family protein [Veillonellales bacterium]